MKIYFATTLAEYYQGQVLTKMRKENRLISYYQSATIVKGKLKHYAKTGWNDKS